MEGVYYRLRIFASRDTMKSSDLATMPFGDPHKTPPNEKFTDALLNHTPVEITNDVVTCRETLVRLLQEAQVYSKILHQNGHSIYVQIVCMGDGDADFANWLKKHDKPDDPIIFYLKYGFLENTDDGDFRIIEGNVSITHKVRSGNWIALSALLVTIRMWRYVEKYAEYTDSKWMLTFSEDYLSGKLESHDLSESDAQLLITASCFSTNYTTTFVNPLYVGWAVDGPRSFIAYQANYYFWNEMISNVYRHNHPKTLDYLRKSSSSLDKWITSRSWQ